jgi:hypothetical protein
MAKIIYEVADLRFPDFGAGRNTGSCSFVYIGNARCVLLKAASDDPSITAGKMFEQSAGIKLILWGDALWERGYCDGLRD